jgi:hypothetical protein
MLMSANGRPPMPTNPPRLDELVRVFIENRNLIKTIKERHKEELAKPLKLREMLAERMLKKLKDNGQEMARTQYGTVTAVTHDSMSCKDANLFIQYVREHDEYELLDRHPNETACKEYLKANGQLPPGVKMNSKQDVSVRATNEKEDI